MGAERGRGGGQNGAERGRNREIGVGRRMGRGQEGNGFGVSVITNILSPFPVMEVKMS